MCGENRRQIEEISYKKIRKSWQTFKLISATLSPLCVAQASLERTSSLTTG
jgi:hypothetical protein